MEIPNELEVNLCVLSYCHGLCHKFISEQTDLLHSELCENPTQHGADVTWGLPERCRSRWEVCCKFIGLHEKVRNTEISGWEGVGA